MNNLVIIEYQSEDEQMQREEYEVLLSLPSHSQQVSISITVDDNHRKVKVFQ